MTAKPKEVPVECKDIQESELKRFFTFAFKGVVFWSHRGNKHNSTNLIGCWKRKVFPLVAFAAGPATTPASGPSDPNEFNVTFLEQGRSRTVSLNTLYYWYPVTDSERIFR